MIPLVVLAAGLTYPLSFGGFTSLIPAIVPDELLPPANALETTSFNAALVIGPGAGGHAVGRVRPGDARCSSRPALALVALGADPAHPRPRPRPRPRGGERTLLGVAADGLRQIVAVPELRGITVGGRDRPGRARPDDGRASRCSRSSTSAASAATPATCGRPSRSARRSARSAWCAIQRRFAARADRAGRLRDLRRADADLAAGGLAGACCCVLIAARRGWRTGRRWPPSSPCASRWCRRRSTGRCSRRRPGSRWARSRWGRGWPGRWRPGSARPRRSLIAAAAAGHGRGASGSTLMRLPAGGRCAQASPGG